jgi:hypothetical protein
MKKKAYLIRIIEENQTAIKFDFVNVQEEKPFDTTLRIVGVPAFNTGINCFTENNELMLIAWDKDVSVKLPATVAKDTEEIYILYHIVDYKNKNHYLLSRYIINNDDVLQLA